MRHLAATALLVLLFRSVSAAPPVARVLQDDPPLPGEALDGWEPLDPAAAPPPEALLDVEQAVALALADSPELRALRANVSAVQGALLDARSSSNPELELGLWSTATEPLARGPVTVGVELDLTDVLDARLQARAARPEIEAVTLRLREGTARLRYEARVAFYDHQAALAAWGASLRAVDALAASRDTAAAIVAAGNAPTLDLARRELAYEEARVRSAELELAVVATRERLARLIRAIPGPVSAILPPVGEMPALPEDLEAAAVAASLELSALDASSLAGQRRVTAARVSGLAPEVGLFAEAEREGEGWEALAGVQVSVPLFSWGRGEAMRAAAEADLLAARRIQSELDIRSAARETRARLESAWRRARHVQDVLVPARDRVLRETLLHYNAMQVDADALLDAWRARVEADVALADALREAWTARAAVDALLEGARVDTPRPAATAARANTDETGGH